MKKFLCALVLVSSLSAMASESNTSGSSYSNGNGGGMSGTSGISGTSMTSAREQVEANKAAVASFIQSEELMSSNPEVKEIVENAKKSMHERIDSMSDREVIGEILQ